MKKNRISICNVLDRGPSGLRLWHFEVDRDKLKLERDATLPPGSPLPAKTVEKDWNNLWKPRLNVAWFPPDHVFLRVVQLPKVDRPELLSMLEFQLERISPLPVAQVLWTVEVVPSSVENEQTAVVCIVNRETVEAHLGSLEADNFQADRLELPLLNQLAAEGVREDGAWLYPIDGVAAQLCMVAWWSAGTLQQVQLLRLPELPAGSGNDSDILAIQAEALHEQLMQIAWAGELEGWLQLPVRWHLVADDQTAARWLPIVSGWSDDPVTSVPTSAAGTLAEFSARRAARMEDAANLLPAEYSARYRQRYIDKLWMGGLGALVSVYVFGVIIYMIALQVFNFRQQQVQSRVVSLANTYTNVLQLKEQVQVLQDQFNLKYAALDCFKVAAELLPPDFNLTWLMFGRGGTLELHGTAPQGQESKITEFNESIRSATADGIALFKEVTAPNIISRPGAQNVTWNFQCHLRVAD